MPVKDSASPRIPVSTYRLQFNYQFTFTDAGNIIHYLHELGITDIYASPYFKARKGSLHGYEVMDPNSLNPELGTEEEYDEADILKHRVEDLKSLLSADDPHLIELLSIITALNHLPDYMEIDQEKIDERYREKEVIKKRLADLFNTDFHTILKRHNCTQN